MEIYERPPWVPEKQEPLVKKTEKTTETNFPKEEQSPDFDQRQDERESNETPEELERKRKEKNEADDKGRLVDIKV